MFSTARRQRQSFLYPLFNCSLKFDHLPNPNILYRKSRTWNPSMGEIENEKKKLKQVKPNKNQPSSPSNTQIIISDFVLSVLWACSNAIIKVLVKQVLGLAHTTTADIVTFAFKIINMFIFAFLIKITKGATYNPLTAMAAATSGGYSRLFFTFAARIPAQVFGSIIGVQLVIATFPGIGRGPKLNVGIQEGALTEGILSFVVVMISLELKKDLPGSFFRKTWISSISKITLNVIGSDLTGGRMNPASAMGWAFARGDYKTQEHLVVYWLAPMVATVFAIGASKLLFLAEKDLKTKSE